MAIKRVNHTVYCSPGPLGARVGSTVGPVGEAVGPVGLVVGKRDGPFGAAVGKGVGPVGADVRLGRAVIGEAVGLLVLDVSVFSKTARILLFPLSDMYRAPIPVLTAKLFGYFK